MTLLLTEHVRFLKPTEEVSHIIVQCAEEEQISPSLLEAVILTESKFNEKAVSHVGAVGMMQLMPETAHWISEQSGLPSDNLASPEQNIPLGAWYLNYLLGQYHNNEVFALAAYNAAAAMWMSGLKRTTGRKGFPTWIRFLSLKPGNL